MKFRILGPLEVSDNGHEIVLAGSKQGALLAILLLHANEVVSSDRLIEELWGERPPPSAHKSLQVHVSRLRRSLGNGDANGSGGIVVTRAGGYLARVEPGELDLERFERLVEEGERALADGARERAVELLREALRLWRGPPLADFTYEPFAQTEIARLEELRLTAIEQRIEAELALGRASRLVGELEPLVAAHPYRERLRAQLMLALYRSGRQTEALEEYGRARQVLVEELGIEPGRELAELQRRILAQDPSLEGPGEAAAPEPLVDARERRRDRRPLLAAAGLLLLAAAVAATVLLISGGSDGDRAAPLTDDSHAVARIDPAEDKVIDVASVGARPGPLAFDRESGSLWVANLDDKSVTHIDARSRRVGRTIALGSAPGGPAAGSAVGGLAAGGGVLWVASANRTNPFVTVEKINTRFDTRERGLRVPASSAYGEADVALRDGSLWVAPSLGLLTRVDPRTGVVRRPRIDPRQSPSAVAVGGGHVWVADGEANTVTRIDPETGLTTAIPVGNGPASLAVGAGAVWVTLALDDSLAQIDLGTGSVRRTVAVGERPAGVAVGAGSVWVANSGDGTVSRVDPETGEVAATVPVGASPQDVVVAGGQVWVSVSPQTIGVAKPGGTARLESAADVSSTDPTGDPSALAVQIWYATGAKLLNYPDAPGPAGSRLEPEVAESLPARSRDGRTYTFRIRRGFRFSPPSNEPVTARTFKHTLERSLNPRMQGYAASVIDDIVGERAYAAGKARHIAGIEAAGDTLRIRLVRPAADFPTRISLPAFAAVPIGTPIDPERLSKVPSAGPYYVASQSPGQGVVLRRNPNYRGKRPHRLREIRLRVGVGQAQAAAHVRAGSADYAVDAVVPGNARRLARRYGPGSPAAKAGRQQYFVNRLLAVDHITLNTSRRLFSSARMRRAVNYAIDRRALARRGGISNSLPGTPTDQYLPPGMPGFRDARLYPSTPDLGRARRLAGGGRRTAVLYAIDEAPSSELAQIVKANLRAIGIDVRVKLLPAELMFERISTKGHPFDMVIEAWYADVADPANFLMLFDGNSIQRRANFNTSYLDDPVFNRRIEAANGLSGPRRYIAHGRLDLDLARSAAPWAAYANETSHDFFSARMGCQVYQPLYGMDLAALCIRK